MKRWRLGGYWGRTDCSECGREMSWDLTKAVTPENVPICELCRPTELINVVISGTPSNDGIYTRPTIGAVYSVVEFYDVVASAPKGSTVIGTVKERKK